MSTTTSPDNIPAPSLTDPYALTQDMLALADGVQTALNRRANTYKGTAVQRVAFTTATNGTLWQDTDGIKMLWRKDSTVAGTWSPAVMNWSGTNAQRVSLTYAPTGFVWVDTGNQDTYTKVATGWVVSLTRRVVRYPLTSGRGLAAPVYYGDMPDMSYGLTFKSQPNLIYTTSVDWGAVQWHELTAETTTGFRHRAVRVGTYPDPAGAVTITYTVTGELV